MAEMMAVTAWCNLVGADFDVAPGAVDILGAFDGRGACPLCLSKP